MIDIYICEDSENFRRSLIDVIQKNILIENRDMQIVLDTADPYAIIDALKGNTKTNMYFLDIELCTTINGIELADKIREVDPTGYIVFITADAEKFLLTFEYKVQALDYIVKMQSDAVNKKIRQCLAYVDDKVKKMNNNQLNVFAFNGKDINGHVQVDDIVYFQIQNAKNKRIILRTTYSQYNFRDTLKNVIEQFTAYPQNVMVLINESTYVNTEKIASIDVKKRKITLINGEVLEVSRRRIKEVKLTLEI